MGMSCDGLIFVRSSLLQDSVLLTKHKGRMQEEPHVYEMPSYRKQHQEALDE